MKQKVKWFCKYCQVEGEIELESGLEISGKEVCRIIAENHESKRTMGGEPWILINIKDSDGFYFGLNLIVNEMHYSMHYSSEDSIVPDFIVLHVL